jgi:peptidoglycan/LPS O-acetylase OafA/YrhL
MSTSGPQERFHSLDALRGWAMLLGIVLHAAWIVASDHYETPITDVDGNVGIDYCFYIIHIFRLQTFFVMAGFFAHLVYSRRGQLQFIWHRVSRIGIPLIVGWLIMYPVMMAQNVAGGLSSGRILSEQGFWVTFLRETAAAFRLNPSILHLWFLYDLLAVYILAVLLRAVFQHALDRSGRLRRWTDRGFARLAHSGWLIVALAVPSAALLYFGQFWWWGINAFPMWFVPQWHGLLIYWLFFAVGWLIYGQWQLLQVVSNGWKWKLAFGTILSVPLFAGFQYAHHHGSPLYPAVFKTEVRNLSDFHAAAQAEESGPQHRVWQSLSPQYRDFLSNRTELTPDQKTGVAAELTKTVVLNPDFYVEADWKDVKIPEDTAEMLANLKQIDDLSRIGLLNRRLLELAMPESIATNSFEQPANKIIKIAYAIGYGLAMWCLVFGVIGAFYNLFPNASPTSRYIADSSYWVYLLHLPVMFQIELWIAGSHWGFWGIPKFIVYNVGTAAVCFLTYHYCVRSTLIGRVLSGRKYPFVPLFGKRPVAESVPASPAIPAPNFRLTGEQRDAVAQPQFHADRSPSVPMEIDLEEA